MLGERRRRNDRVQEMWAACVDCGKRRWVQLAGGKPRHIRCLSCARKHTIATCVHKYSEDKPGRGLRLRRHCEICGALLSISREARCQPHYWLVNEFNIGRCKKCGAVRDFSEKLLKRLDKPSPIGYTHK